jgi:uracil-DNA glycosylase
VTPRLPAPDPVADAVRSAAGRSHDLAGLAVAATACTACPELVAERACVVVGDTPAGARLALLGEAPGAQEDATGRPFVGRSGQLLDALLTAAGGRREDVAVLNTLKCRPPGNRPPRPQESRRCRGWVERQLALADPSLVVALGLSATRWFLGPTSLASARGRVHEVDVGGRPTRVLATYHPSAALRFGPAGEPRRLLQEDLARALELTRP